MARKQPVVAPGRRQILEVDEPRAVPFVEARQGAWWRRLAGMGDALGERQEVPALEREMAPLLGGEGLEGLEGLEPAVAPARRWWREPHLVGPVAAAQARCGEKLPVPDTKNFRIFAARDRQALVLDERAVLARR